MRGDQLMKKDVKIAVRIDTIEDLEKVIKTVNKSLEKECNCTCTLEILVRN